jgi:ABC-2 type transport system ATP-binding protein
MAQLIQLLSTIIHDPKLLIFDEPFSGLDPVNVKMVKDIIKDLRKQGKALILSTHRMNEIEEICDSIFMINKGRSVLYGRLDEVKRRFRRNSVIIDFDGELGRLEGAASMKVNGNTTEVTLNAGVNPSQILKQLAIQKIIVNRFEVATPSLNEIFLRIAGEN